MTEKFEYDGFWWLPGNSDEQIPGTLTFDPTQGAFLKLLDSFSEWGEEPLNSDIKCDIVLGISINNQITLYNCRKTKQVLGGYFRPSTIFAETVLVDNHFCKKEDITFRRVVVDYSNLDEWVNISGFDSKLLAKAYDDFKSKREFNVAYRYPELSENRAVIDSLGEVYLSIAIKLPSSDFVQKEVYIKQSAKICIKLKEKRSLLDYKAVIDKIQNFLSLGVSSPVYPVSIKGFLLEENSKSLPISIYYRLPNVPKIDGNILPNQMLFNLSDLSGDFAQYLKRWFDKYDLLEPTFKNYFGIIHTPGINRMNELLFTNQFLNLMQAIESYHAKRYGDEGQYQSDEKYFNRLYPRLTDFLYSLPTDIIDSDFRDNLVKNSFKYLHHHSLRKRFKNIFKRFENTISNKIGNTDKEMNNFINKAVATRNYYTHLGEMSEDVVNSNRELQKISAKLAFLIELCFLYELEISEDVIKEIVSRNKNYYFD
jgi:hypothetical protein